MHMLYKILITILVNLCLLNIFILDFITELDKLSLAIYQLSTHFKFINVSSTSLIQNNNNNEKNKNLCLLNCSDQLQKIKYFYEKESQFKNKYYMIPIKITNLNNYECRILYYTKPIITNNRPMNMFKDIRVFKFSHINIYSCSWFITDMSVSLWPQSKKSNNSIK